MRLSFLTLISLAACCIKAPDVSAADALVGLPKREDCIPGGGEMLLLGTDHLTPAQLRENYVRIRYASMCRVTDLLSDRLLLRLWEVMSSEVKARDGEQRFYTRIAPDGVVTVYHVNEADPDRITQRSFNVAPDYSVSHIMDQLLVPDPVVRAKWNEPVPCDDAAFDRATSCEIEAQVVLIDLAGAAWKNKILMLGD